MGGAKLYGPGGFWSDVRWASFYRVRPAVRLALGLLAVSLGIFAAPVLLGLALGVFFPLILIADRVLPGVASRFVALLWVAPEELSGPYLAAQAVPVFGLALLAIVTVAYVYLRDRRRFAEAFESFLDARPGLLRLRGGLAKVAAGASLGDRPSGPELGRRYVSFLAENLGRAGLPRADPADGRPGPRRGAQLRAAARRRGGRSRRAPGRARGLRRPAAAGARRALLRRARDRSAVSDRDAAAARLLPEGRRPRGRDAPPDRRQLRPGQRDRGGGRGRGRAGDRGAGRARDDRAARPPPRSAGTDRRLAAHARGAGRARDRRDASAGTASSARSATVRRAAGVPGRTRRPGRSTRRSTCG